MKTQTKKRFETLAAFNADLKMMCYQLCQRKGLKKDMWLAVYKKMVKQVL